MALLIPGTKAPAFALKNQAGKKIQLKDFLGKKVILYFYPEDDTPLCTVEACHLKDHLPRFNNNNVVILGVSPDEPESHQLFIDKFQLPFSLLSDPDHDMMTKYGVWAEKIMFGNRFMGVKRVTYLINEKGVIDQVIGKVISKKQIDQIVKHWPQLK